MVHVLGPPERREVRIRAPTFFGVVYFSRGAQKNKKGGKRPALGDLVFPSLQPTHARSSQNPGSRVQVFALEGPACTFLGESHWLQTLLVHLYTGIRMHHTPEHCNLQMVESTFILVLKKQHVSNGCKMYILRSPVIPTPKLEFGLNIPKHPSVLDRPSSKANRPTNPTRLHVSARTRAHTRASTPDA